MTYDVIIIGAGPAGSTVATIAAQQGLKALLLEREKMPRFHVGESLMPETYWIFQRLGVLDKMKASAAVKKMSVQFVSHTGKHSQPFYFKQHDPRECTQTWQVVRSEFDQMLFENAASHGAECRDQTRVVDVLMQNDRATGVNIQGADGSTEEIAASVVVDATGQQTFLASKLGLVQHDDELRKTAIWGYYQGAKRDQGRNAGATIILHTKEKKAWFWFIPLADDLTSVGVVGDQDYLIQSRGTPESIFEEELVNCPAVLSRLVDAKLTTKFHVAREFSYNTRRSAGDGWVLVGDAFGFIDPVYSSGVYFAMKTGELAADAIVAAIHNQDTTAAALGGWIPEFLAAAQRVRKLINAFYTNSFSFGRFMKAHPQHQGNLTDLLIGRIFKPSSGEIFNDMDRWLQE